MHILQTVTSLENSFLLPRWRNCGVRRKLRRSWKILGCLCDWGDHLERYWDVLNLWVVGRPLRWIFHLSKVSTWESIFLGNDYEFQPKTFTWFIFQIQIEPQCAVLVPYLSKIRRRVMAIPNLDTKKLIKIHNVDIWEAQYLYH